MLLRACNETNLMHYSPSVYSFTITLRVSGLLVADHQGDNWYVLYILVDCRLACLRWVPT
jgi:hypothetical protein